MARYSGPFPRLADRYHRNRRSLPDRVSFCRRRQIPNPVGSAAPIPFYGHGVFLYAVFFVAAIIALIISTWRDLRSTSGGEHAELAFILIGGLSALTFACFCPSRSVFSSSQPACSGSRLSALSFSAWWSPMASRPERSWRWACSFGAPCPMRFSPPIFWPSTAWFGGWSSLFSSRNCRMSAKSLAHVVAAIVVAFAMAPARGVSQSLADKLFLGTRRLDFRSTMNEAAAILKSVTTLAGLARAFREDHRRRRRDGQCVHPAAGP